MGLHKSEDIFPKDDALKCLWFLALSFDQIQSKQIAECDQTQVKGSQSCQHMV